MNSDLIRMGVAMLFAVILLVQSRNVRERPHRKRGLEIASAALFCFALLNGSMVAGADFGLLQTILGLAGVALLVVSALQIAQAYRSGEMKPDSEKIAQAARDYRERHRPTSDD